MEKKEIEKYELTIKTNDIASENFVIDGQFNRVARSIGNNSSFILPKGLYSVKVKVGDDFLEKPVTLTESRTLEFDPIAFNTPAPISGTYDTTESQINTAIIHSKKDKSDVEIGKGCRLFLFGSIPSEALQSNMPEPNTDPAVGLTLRTFNDDLLVNFRSPNVGTYNREGEPWAACDIDINPGCYVLCVETNNGNHYKQTIVACSGWQTQIFLQPRNYGISEKEVKADLINSSILMSRIEYGFNAAEQVNFQDGTNYRLTEQLSHALRGRRKVISEELLQILLSGKFDNPMLGIYGAHLLLQASTDSSYSKVETIVENLRTLLGDSHPDVEAIALKIGMSTDHVFREFPMLANSWGFVLEASASVERASLIPTDSIAYKLAGQFWSNELWLIWGNTDKNENKQLKQEIVKLVQQEAKPDATGEDINLLSGLTKAAGTNKRLKDEVLTHLSSYKRGLDDIMSKLTIDKILGITKSLGIPHQKVIDLIGQMKLDDLTSAVKQFNVQFPLVSDDPQKGQWGGNSENNFRKMNASVVSSKIPGLFTVTINVISTKEDFPLKGDVKFHLHDTFLNPTPVVAVTDGKATLELNGVWGAFTIGAEADEGETKLELDLSELKGAPESFKSR